MALEIPNFSPELAALLRRPNPMMADQTPGRVIRPGEPGSFPVFSPDQLPNLPNMPPGARTPVTLPPVNPGPLPMTRNPISPAQAGAEMDRAAAPSDWGRTPTPAGNSLDIGTAPVHPNRASGWRTVPTTAADASSTTLPVPPAASTGPSATVHDVVRHSGPLRSTRGPAPIPNSPAIQPGMPGGPPDTFNWEPERGMSRVTQTPYANPTTTLPVSGVPAALPQPTSDPAVAPMQQPTDIMQYMNPALAQMRADLEGYRKADEANRIDPQAVKPRLWERLVGFGLGATQLRNPENAGNIAGEVVNRRRNAAELARNTALAPWTQRLEQDRTVSLPMARDVAETAGKQAELGLKTHQENRETWTAQQQSQWHDAEAAIRKEYDEGRIADMEQHFKDLAEKYKDDEQMKNKLLDLREQMLKLQQEKLDKGKDHTAQVTSAETQKSNALAKAHTEYARATKDLPTDPKAAWTDEQKGQLQQAQESYNTAAQEAEDAYEAKVAELGGSMAHQDVTTDWAKGKGKTAPAGGKTETKSELPTEYGPKGEKPAKTGKDAQGRPYGYFKSTGQWMLVPTENKQ